MVVLCKEIQAQPGCILFYTNYESRKGKELSRIPGPRWYFTGTTATARCGPKAGWSACPGAESDDYFRSRAWQSRLGAWASEQRRTGGLRQTLVSAVAAAARRFGIDYGGPGTPNPMTSTRTYLAPPHWGGFKLCADAVELWVEGEFRIHDRARWTAP